MSIGEPAPTTADREIGSARTFDAPRGAVFGAFSDPAVLARWWGPNGFTSTFHEFDFRPGGAWRFVLHGPDGTDHPTEKRFLDIAAPQLIRFRHVSSVHGFVMTMAFEAAGSGTLLTWTMLFDSADEAAKVRAIILAANEENFDRL